MHKRLDEFEFLPDGAIAYKVSCPFVYKIDVSDFYAPNFEKVGGAYCFWSVRA